MKRLTKFRAWDKIDKRMIVHEQDFIPLKITNIGVFRLNPHHEENFWELLPEERFELNEFTGLLDRNGKEVFEGDLVKGFFRYEEDDLDARRPIVCAVVEMISTWWGVKGIEMGIGWNFALGRIIDIEVIGNQFENPELL